MIHKYAAGALRTEIDVSSGGGRWTLGVRKDSRRREVNGVVWRVAPKTRNRKPRHLDPREGSETELAAAKTPSLLDEHQG